jgi:flagellin
LLQTADGALSQVTSLLDRAVTLATEASNGGLTLAQSKAADTEFQSILSQIGSIGSTTNFNSTAVFNQAAGTDFVLTDGTATGVTTITSAATALTAASIGTVAFGAGDTLTDAASTTAAQTAAAKTLIDVTNAIAGISAQRGAIGANINQLNAASNVASTESVNLSAAQSTIQATNFGQATSDLAKFQVLSQTGISALAQANSVQQEILKLLQ